MLLDNAFLCIWHVYCDGLYIVQYKNMLFYNGGVLIRMSRSKNCFELQSLTDIMKWKWDKKILNNIKRHDHKRSDYEFLMKKMLFCARLSNCTIWSLLNCPCGKYFSSFINLWVLHNKFSFNWKDKVVYWEWRTMNYEIHTFNGMHFPHSSNLIVRAHSYIFQ